MLARINLRYALVAALLVAVAGPALAAMAPAVVASCDACHGTAGVSTHKDVPSIAGMSDFYLEGQILAYQKGQRPCPKSSLSGAPTDMCEVAKKLDGAQTKAIGMYYPMQSWVAAAQSGLNPALIAKGRSIEAANCEICHTKGGSVKVDDAGILAGQWLPYLQMTLQDYKSGKRLPPTAMKPKIDALSADDLDAVAQFYASESSTPK